MTISRPDESRPSYFYRTASVCSRGQRLPTLLLNFRSAAQLVVVAAVHL